MLKHMKLKNYLLWQQERGLSSAKKSRVPLSVTPARISHPNSRVLFVLGQSPDLDEQAAVMGLLDRLIIALGRERDSVQVQVLQKSTDPQLASIIATNWEGIVAFGSIASEALRLHGGIESGLHTYHPAEMLLRPELKIQAWKDLQVLVNRVVH